MISFPGLIQTTRRIRNRPFLRNSKGSTRWTRRSRSKVVQSRRCTKGTTSNSENWSRSSRNAKKLQQELSSLDANSTGLLVLPQADTVADEQVKAELSALLTQEQALQTARKQMALGFAANPTLVRQRCVERNPTLLDRRRHSNTVDSGRRGRHGTSQTSRQTIRSSR